MSIAAVAHHHHALPDTPHNLWVRGELARHLHLPDDGSRVEIIGGEIVVSPGPTVGHNGIVQDVADSVVACRINDPTFPWRCVQTTDLNLSDIHDGYIPDLIIADAKVLADARREEAPHLLPHQVGLVMEVTSRWNAGDDRQPSLRRTTATKWNGYAQVEVPYYLLVDRDPIRAQIILYSKPDRTGGVYAHVQSWELGETIRLPEPFGVTIETDGWEPWR